jgi:hypothetical protein
MSLVDKQWEYVVDDQPTPVPMDSAQAYFMGSVEGGTKALVDRAIAIMVNMPTVSAGTFSIGTNSPNYDDIIGATAWGLIGLGAEGAKDYKVLEADGSAFSLAPSADIYLKVTPGIGDDGGSVRVILIGFQYPTS